MGGGGSAGGGIGSAVGSVIGGLSGAGNGASGNANDLANISNNILQQIQNAPDISKPLILQQYKQAGLLTPEMEQNITAQIPAAIGQDTQAVNAQRQALTQMQQRAAGGLSAGDRAALTEANLKSQGDVASRLASIQQNAQQQGTADSGTALAAQLAAAQGGANTEASNANQLAQQAQQAAIQSTAQAAGLGSQLEGQNFNEGLQNQQAQQQMQRFNIQNQLGVQQQNVGAANQAQAANLANAQQTSNQNVSQNNAEQYNQLQRQMQQYGANVGAAQIKAGGAGALSQQQAALGKQQNQAAVNMGAGIGGIAGTAAGAAMSQGGPVDFRNGGHVPGRANVSGDSPLNDTVDAKLSPGEHVIKRSIAQSPIGKKLIKLLEDHHAVQKELDKHEGNG